MTFSDSLATATKNGLCGIISGFAAYSAMHNRIFGRVSPFPDPTNYWRSLNRQICNKEQPGGDSPFEGGGCDNIPYRVTSIINNNVSSACARFNSTRINTVYGPVQNVYLAPDPNPPTQPNRWSYYITARQAINGPIVTDKYYSFTASPGSGCRDPYFVDVDIVRLDGLPEQECDRDILPPQPPPPGWNKVIINNFTWNNNFGDVINEGDLELTFGFAYLSADFDIEIPVKVDVGGINFNGNFNFDKGAFNIDFSRDVINNNGDIVIRRPDGDNRELPDPLPDNPERPDDIDDDPDVIEDDENPNENEEGEARILAVRVVVSSVNNKSIGTFLQNKNPDIAIPNYGYIQFFIPTFDGEGAWSSDIPIKNANSFIPCPWPDGATRARGTPRSGVSWSIQALRSKISTKIVFP